jgi:hypothetical protein
MPQSFANRVGAFMKNALMIETAADKIKAKALWAVGG